MPSTSRPRAATSVATKILARPLRKSDKKSSEFPPPLLPPLPIFPLPLFRLSRPIPPPPPKLLRRSMRPE
uniref:Uncharacterized protein n=1 Tax=Glossina pallidipes TaxID=7398 RepID=A0A1A9Z699_GLOPL